MATTEKAPAKKRSLADVLSGGGGGGGDDDAPEGNARKRSRTVKDDYSKEELQLVALCHANPEGVTQSLLEKEMGVSAEVGVAINELLKKGRLSLFRKGKNAEMLYKLVSEDEAKKTKGLNKFEKIVYDAVAKSGNKGIWIQDLRRQTGLGNDVAKLLKKLDTMKLIKSVKHHEAHNKRVYMLAELAPAAEVIGRVWYNESKFDQEFVTTLRQMSLQFLTKSRQLSHVEVHDRIKRSGIIRVALSDDDVNSILLAMFYDGLLDIVNADPQRLAVRLSGAKKHRTGQSAPTVYKIANSGVGASPFTSIPCCSCPVAADCAIGSLINPVSCQYISQVLDF